MLSLRETPLPERPRERLSRDGAQVLTDAALLAVILGSGVKGRDVLRVARELLTVIDAKWPRVTVPDLTAVAGIGTAKAALIAATLEFARRRIRPSGIKIKESRDILPLIQHLADRQQEHFICISLNGAHEVIATRVVTIGLVNATQVHPREVFADPITDRAAAIVVAHNHPSGQLIPSDEDRTVTRRLKEAGALLGIKVLDHLIFGVRGYYSFADCGEI